MVFCEHAAGEDMFAWSALALVFAVPWARAFITVCPEADMVRYARSACGQVKLVVAERGQYLDFLVFQEFAGPFESRLEFLDLVQFKR